VRVKVRVYIVLVVAEEGKNTYSKLLVLLTDTSVGVDVINVVGEQSVTGVLRNDTEGDDNGKSPPVTLGAEEVHVAGALVGLGLHDDGLLDLTELELDGSVGRVATTVMLDEDIKGLIGLVLADEVTGGLGNPPDTAELEDGGEGLDEGDGPPAPVAVDLGGAPADDGDDCEVAVLAKHRGRVS